MATVEKADVGSMTDKIEMSELTAEGTDYIITGFEYKEFNPGEKTPCLLLEGEKHVEVKPQANNALIDAWGTDTDDWVGYSVKVSKKQFSKGTGRLVTPLTDKPKQEVPF